MLKYEISFSAAMLKRSRY